MIYSEKWGTKKIAARNSRKRKQKGAAVKVAALLDKVLKSGQTRKV